MSDQDDYDGYNQVQKVTHCGCWVHARRAWQEAMPDGAAVKISKAAVGFQYCMILFSLKEKYIYVDVKARNNYLQNVVCPLLEESFAWLKMVSTLKDVVRYSPNQKGQLMSFLDYDDVPISNNLMENAIRPFVIGRKNRLFCYSVKGAESSALCILWKKLPRLTVLSFTYI